MPKEAKKQQIVGDRLHCVRVYVCVHVRVRLFYVHTYVFACVCV